MSGLLEKGTEHYEQAVREMERAKKHLLRTPGFFFFGYPVLAREMADCYDRLGQEKERQEILDEAVRELAEKNYQSEIPQLRALRDRKDFPVKLYTFPIVKELLREIRALYSEAAIKRYSVQIRNTLSRGRTCLPKTSRSRRCATMQSRLR